jgi:uncharacterized OB-fold protein
MTTPSPASDRARHCIKCGREVGPDESMCEVCNRAGMATPSASQYHGTVVVAIVLAVAALALAGSLSLRGVGPYAAEVRAVVPAGEGYTVAFAVTNEGTNPGRAKCQLTALASSGQQLRVRNTLTAQIPGEETLEVAETLADLAEAPADVRVTCS